MDGITAVSIVVFLVYGSLCFVAGAAWASFPRNDKAEETRDAAQHRTG